MTSFIPGADKEVLAKRIFQERTVKNMWSFFGSEDKSWHLFVTCLCKIQDTFEEEANESLSYVRCGKGIAAMHNAIENLAFKWADALFFPSPVATKMHFSNVFKITLRNCIDNSFLS